jgi:hypothetical protein
VRRHSSISGVRPAAIHRLAQIDSLISSLILGGYGRFSDFRDKYQGGLLVGVCSMDSVLESTTLAPTTRAVFRSLYGDYFLRIRDSTCAGDLTSSGTKPGKESNRAISRQSFRRRSVLQSLLLHSAVSVIHKPHWTAVGYRILYDHRSAAFRGPLVGLTPPDFGGYGSRHRDAIIYSNG